MAKKNKQFVTAPPPESAQDLEESTLPAEEQAELYVDEGIQKVFKILKGLNLSGGKVGIFLKRNNVLKAGYVGEMPLEQFQTDGFETLKRMYGGGDYTLQFKDGAGMIVTQAPLTIDPRFKGEIDAEKAVVNENNDTNDQLAKIVEKLKPAPAQDNSMMPLMITLITESQKTMVALMSENQKSTNAILTGLMAAITAAQDKKATDPALLELIKQKSDKTPLTETIEAMVAIRELTADGSPKEKDDMVEKFIKLAGPTLMNFLATRMGPQMAMPPAQAPVVVEQPRAIAEAAVDQGGRGSPPSHATGPAANGGPEPKLAGFIPFLLNAAKKKTEPEAYYEFICDNITDEQLGKLIVELETPTWFESLFGTHPEVVAQRAWFEELRQVFLAPDEEEVDEPPAEAKAAGAK